MHVHVQVFYRCNYTHEPLETKFYQDIKCTFDNTCTSRVQEHMGNRFRHFSPLKIAKYHVNHTHSETLEAHLKIYVSHQAAQTITALHTLILMHS